MEVWICWRFPLGSRVSVSFGCRLMGPRVPGGGLGIGVLVGGRVDRVEVRS
ncbi:hypothetical protein ACQP1P_01080 [Dactylosporangium sp. CA-052675]|uniref:hypothetical protein n=1 Tax=Dactylosporangium sp. CA-052675 TaxID=3239927 RepID=UPI003D90A8EE